MNKFHIFTFQKKIKKIKPQENRELHKQEREKTQKQVQNRIIKRKKKLG
jgi:hypothetical protein